MFNKFLNHAIENVVEFTEFLGNTDRNTIYFDGFTVNKIEITEGDIYRESVYFHILEVREGDKSINICVPYIINSYYGIDVYLRESYECELVTKYIQVWEKI